MPEKIVIVGYGTAGSAAATQILRKRKCELIIVDEKEKEIFHPCMMPYALAFNFKGLEGIVEEDKLLRKRAKILSGWRAVKLGTKTKEVTVEKSNEFRKIKFDKLILALGSKPFVPPVKGVGMEGVFTLSNVTDYLKLNMTIKKGHNAVVVGGGAIGLEIAYALNKRGLNVTLIEMMKSLLPRNLDPDLANKIREEVVKEGVKVYLGMKVTEVKGRNGKEVNEVVLENGEELSADLVIFATGAKPNVSIAVEAGIELGKHGGILVNERMETSLSDVFAAGDCVEVKNLITGEYSLNMLACTAYEEGKVAGINASGGEEHFKGALPAFTGHAFDLEYGSVGLLTEEAKRTKSKIFVMKSRGFDKEKFLTEGFLEVKILADESGNLVGVQCLGSSRCTEVVNLAQIAIKERVNVKSLAEMQFAYCPPLSGFFFPFKTACEVLSERIKKER